MRSNKINWKFIFTMTVLILGWSESGFGFINIESLRQENKAGLSGSGALQVSGQAGNTNKFSGSASALTIEKLQRDELLFLLSDQYGLTSGIKDTNNAQAHLRYTFFEEEKYAFEVFTQREFDEFKNLNARTLLGANIRERLAKTSEQNLYFGLGGFYEWQVYVGDLERDGLRANAYLSFATQLNESVSSSATLYYQPLFKDLNDFRIRFQADFDFNLNATTALSAVYVLNDCSWVPANIVRTDMTYLCRLKVKF